MNEPETTTVVKTAFYCFDYLSNSEPTKLFAARIGAWGLQILPQTKQHKIYATMNSVLLPWSHLDRPLPWDFKWCRIWSR